MSITAISQGHGFRHHRGIEAGTARSAGVAASRNDGWRAGRPESDGDEVSRPQNPLVAAMLKAVQALASPTAVPTTTAIAPAATAATAAATPASATAGTATATADTGATSATTATQTAPANAATSLKDAAVAFAHELFGALGEGGRGVGHHHGHHGHHPGYGDLAQRLETLASRLAPATTPTAATGSTPVQGATPAPATAVATPEPVVDGTPTTGPGGDTALSIHIDIRFNQARVADDRQASLINAYEQFAKALNPAKKETTDSTAAATSSAVQLASFLRSIAASLRAGAATAPSAAPAAGSLVDVSA